MTPVEALERVLHCLDRAHETGFKTKAFIRALEVVRATPHDELVERAAAWVREQNGGKERKPTVDVAGQILCTPTDHELTSALRERGLMA